jgi:predicted ATPase
MTAGDPPGSRRRFVLTGGPGAGKTAVLEVVRQAFAWQVQVLPEAAGIVFGGGFPRTREDVCRRAGQRAIYHVQRELEAVADAGAQAVVLCDRGTVDGAAYWPGPDEFWPSVGTTMADELARYDLVIHLRTPSSAHGYNRVNPLRIESAEEAAAIDERILDAWASHPRRIIIPAAPDFLAKAGQAIDVIASELARLHGEPPGLDAANVLPRR